MDFIYFAVSSLILSSLFLAKTDYMSPLLKGVNPDAIGCSNNDCDDLYGVNWFFVDIKSLRESLRDF